MTGARQRRAIAAVAILAYLASVVAANYLTTRYGFIPVGFGKTATAGTFAAGAALVVRDVVQDAIGRVGVAVLILAAAALSFLVAAPAIAVASGCAFLISEALDMALYTPLRSRARFGDTRWSIAVAVAGVVGAVADSVVFLIIAFGAASVRAALPGQLLGKAEVIAALIFAGVAGRALLRQPLNSKGA